MAAKMAAACCFVFVDTLSKKYGKDQETIQSSTTPDPGYHMGKQQKYNKHHQQEIICSNSNLVIYHPISSTFHMWITFIKLFPKIVCGFCLKNDKQDAAQTAIRHFAGPFIRSDSFPCTG